MNNGRDMLKGGIDGVPEIIRRSCYKSKNKEKDINSVCPKSCVGQLFVTTKIAHIKKNFIISRPIYK